MFLYHAASVRLVDVFHCMMGLVTCDFSVTGQLLFHTMRNLQIDQSLDNRPHAGTTGLDQAQSLSSAKNANNHQHLTTVAYPSCGGTGTIASLIVATCPTDAKHCTLDTSGSISLVLTYTTPVLIDPDNDDEDTAARANAILTYTLTELQSGKVIALDGNGVDVCGWQDCPVQAGGKVTFESDVLTDDKWAGKEYTLRLSIAVPSQTIVCAEVAIGFVETSDGGECGDGDEDSDRDRRSHPFDHGKGKELRY